MTQGRLSKGQELLIILPEFKDGKPVKIHSVVSRITSVGVGVEFKAMRQEQKTAILALASAYNKSILGKRLEIIWDLVFGNSGSSSRYVHQPEHPIAPPLLFLDGL